MDPSVDSEASSKRGSLWSVVQALRPHQWAKNLVLFVPLMLTPDELVNQSKQMAVGYRAWLRMAYAKLGVSRSCRCFIRWLR